jgi:trehalose-phosphatase
MATLSSTQVKVKAVFLDYDGTISPLNVSRSKSAVLAENLKVLRKISQLMPVAIITTKDLRFVVPRTTFAHAWAGLAGLELKIGGVVKKTKAKRLRAAQPYLTAALEYARSFSGNGLTIEEKHASNGTVIAFSVDWRRAKNKREAKKRARQILNRCEKLVPIRYAGQPFVDVFPCRINKGKALLALKRKLGLHDGVLYMGDSLVDNAAFEVADIAVGVLHKETPPNLLCDFHVKFEEVASFLRALLDNNFCIDLKSPFLG